MYQQGGAGEWTTRLSLHLPTATHAKDQRPSCRAILSFKCTKRNWSENNKFYLKLKKIFFKKGQSRHRHTSPPLMIPGAGSPCTAHIVRCGNLLIGFTRFAVSIYLGRRVVPLSHGCRRNRAARAGWSVTRTAGGCPPLGASVK